MSTRNMETSLEQNEVLIKELYNRAKSNMQLISDLINIKLAQTDNSTVKEVLADCETKIITMSRVHELIYESSNMSEIDLRGYIGDICDILFRVKKVPRGSVVIDNLLDEIDINLNVAIPLGMIINELVTNSLNCGFASNTKGKIIFRGENAGNRLFLEYHDNGVGLPASFSLENLHTHGLKLIHDIIITQLLGSVEFENRNGFYCSMIIDLAIH
ncbi:MAG: sensor histidine kinase [Spirochaetales bacterium]|nr:sensor histidine kinase [Spirochaetales bacterium]